MVALYVLALLYKDNDLLLVRRHNVDFGSGLYSFVGGAVNEGERALQAIQREVKEETGLSVPEEDFSLVHIINRKGTENNMVILFFMADIAAMPKPVIKEPKKHDDMRFFRFDELPENMIPAHKQALECITIHSPYSEHGWEQ
jgi:8-oxo-dGTP diphosphatase